MHPACEDLINSLIKDGYLKTPYIIEAFRAIDRADFVLEEEKANAYINAPLLIGFNQTISQPLVVAFMLELLEPKPGERILDVGAGSGYTAALLGQICLRSTDYSLPLEKPEDRSPLAVVRSQPLVVAMERIPELKQFAEANLNKYGFIEKGMVRIVKGDGSRGYKKEAPYDKILSGAAADGEVPKAWKEQLKIGGRIVAPVGPNIVVIDKTGKNKHTQKEYFGFSFVPLIRD